MQGLRWASLSQETLPGSHWAVQLSGICPELQLANNLNSSKAEGPVLPDGIGGKKLRLGLQGQRGDVLGIVFQESTS